MHSMSSVQRNQHGFSLAFVLIVMMVVGLLMAGMFSVVLPTVRSVTASKVNTSLRCVAESSLDYVVNRVAAGDTNYICLQGEPPKNVTIPSNIIGSNGSQVINATAVIANVPCPTNSYLHRDDRDPNVKGSAVTTNNWMTVTANATTGGSSLRLRAVMMPEITTVTAQPTPWNLPNRGMTLGGNYTANGGIQVDSYNSKSDPTASKNTKNSHIFANGYIDLGNANSAWYYGDVTYVDTANTGKSNNGKGNVTGTWSKSTTLQTFPPPPSVPATAKSISPITSNISLNGDYVIDVGNSTTKGGNPAITLNGKNAQITVTGPTRLWVTGKSPTITLGGNGLVNTTSIPANFQLFYLPTDPDTTKNSTNIQYKGNSGMHGVIYAPSTGFLQQGGSNFYGAVVTNNADMGGGGNGGGFHYDETLSGFPLFNWIPPSSTSVQHSRATSWEELN